MATWDHFDRQKEFYIHLLQHAVTHFEVWKIKLHVFSGDTGYKVELKHNK